MLYFCYEKYTNFVFLEINFDMYAICFTCHYCLSGV